MPSSRDEFHTERTLTASSAPAVRELDLTTINALAGRLRGRVVGPHDADVIATDVVGLYAPGLQ